MAQPLAIKLLDLPTEIHLQILSYLDYAPCLALSQTNSYFRSMITAENLTSRWRRLSWLYAVENWTEYESHFACSICLNLRLWSAFGDKQPKGRRGKGHAESNRRFCVDCGIEKRKYQCGRIIDSNKNTRYLCGLCWRLCRSGLYCTLCAACQCCLERRRTIRNSQLGTTTEPDYAKRKCTRCSRPYADLGPGHEVNDAELMTIMQNLPLALKMAEFQEDFGMMASPEWYEEDIAHGNF